MTEPTCWARVLPPGLKPLRRGAWYPVLEEEDSILTIEVQGSPLWVNRELVSIRTVAPTAWSVVRCKATDPPPVDATDALGLLYAVCPGCRGRVPVDESVHEIACTLCGHTAPVDWTDEC